MKDKRWEKALIEILNSKRGYLKDLENKIGEDMISHLELGGLINFGCSPTQRTWKISKFGSLFIRQMKLC